MARTLQPERDAGFGLVEAVVALLLLALVMVPVTRMALTSAQVSDSEHLRVEAADIANSALANVTYHAEQGQQWSEGITTSTASSGADQFLVAVDVEPVDATAQCADGGIPQAWSAQATVGWNASTVQAASAAGDVVVQSTLIPAPSSTQASSGYGEIAIPVYGPNEALETSQPIEVTLTGQCVGSSCPATPYPQGPPFADESVSTGTSGCAIFTGLYAGGGWSYVASVSNSNGYVDPAEHSSGAGAVAPSLSSPLTAGAGTVTTVPQASAFLLAPAHPVAITFDPTAFVGQTTAGASFVPPLPIALDSTAPGPSCAEGCTLGDGVSSFNGEQVALLYPPTVAGSSASNDYAGYAGTWPSANPTTYCQSGSGAGGCSYGPVAFNSSNGSVSLPVYPLVFTITPLPSGTPATLAATPAGTSMTLALATPATSGSSARSATALPLGLYRLSASSSITVPSYVWITPTGVCSYTSGTAPATPCASPSQAAIAVTG